MEQCLSYEALSTLPSQVSDNENLPETRDLLLNFENGESNVEDKPDTDFQSENEEDASTNEEKEVSINDGPRDYNR